MINDGSFRPPGTLRGAYRPVCEGGPTLSWHRRDMITIDLDKKILELEVPEEEIARRLKEAKAPDHKAPGMLAAYQECVHGADEGALWLYDRKKNDRPGAAQSQTKKMKNGGKRRDDRMNVIMFVVGLVLAFALMIKTKIWALYLHADRRAVHRPDQRPGDQRDHRRLRRRLWGHLQEHRAAGDLRDNLGRISGKSMPARKSLPLCWKYTGNKITSAALSITGFIVAIPVFSDVAMVLLSPIVKNVGKKSGKNACALGTATACSLLSTNAFVAPPGTFGRSGHPGIECQGPIAYGLYAAVTTLAVWAFTEFYLLKKPTAGTRNCWRKIRHTEKKKGCPGKEMPSFLASLPLS